MEVWRDEVRTPQGLSLKTVSGVLILGLIRMGYLYKKIFTSIRCDIFDTQMFHSMAVK